MLDGLSVRELFLAVCCYWLVMGMQEEMRREGERGQKQQAGPVYAPLDQGTKYGQRPPSPPLTNLVSVLQQHWTEVV